MWETVENSVTDPSVPIPTETGHEACYPARMPVMRRGRGVAHLFVTTKYYRDSDHKWKQFFQYVISCDLERGRFLYKISI